MLTSRLVQYHLSIFHIAIVSLLTGASGASLSQGANVPAALTVPPPASTGTVPDRMATQAARTATIQDLSPQPDGQAEAAGMGTAEEAPPVPVLPDLPDSGPRYVTPIEGPGADAFQLGVAAYGRHDAVQAESAFRSVVAQHPHGLLADAAHAFLAELLIDEEGTPHSRQMAIDAYRRIIRDFPRTSNGGRAYWRIGDLYVAMNMRTEAHGAYEHGAATLVEGDDADRALLGAATNYAAAKTWREAERLFKRVNGRTMDEVIREHSTIGLADVFYAQKHFQSAQPLYEEAWRRWPAFLKERPASLLRAADNAGLAGRPVLARQISLTFYNLYPQSGQAPQALLQIGDSFRQTGPQAQAVLFYGETILRYPESPTAPAARMRLAQMGLEQASADREHLLKATVESLFRTGPTPNLDTVERAQVLRAVAAATPKAISGSEALYHLGEHYEATNDPAHMIQAYGAAVSRVGRIPDDPWPTAAGQRLTLLVTPLILAALAEKDDFKAVSFFQPLWGSDEAIFAGDDMILAMAGAYRRVGFTPEAVRLYQYLLQARSGPSIREESIINLGQTYLDQEDFSAARQVFDRYRLQYPLGRWKTEALRWLILSYRGQGDHEGVIRTSRRWFQLYPTHPARQEIRRMLAQALASAGHTEEALQLYADLERINARANAADPDLLIQYADLLYQVKRYDDAVTRYWQALRAAPAPRQTDWVRLQLARVWRVQAHVAAARGVLDDLSRLTDDELVARASASMRADLNGTGKVGVGGPGTRLAGEAPGPAPTTKGGS